MSRKVRKSWLRGLARGYENSGEFIGTFVPIMLAVLFVVIALGVLVRANTCAQSSDSGPCRDYSYRTSGTLECKRWPGMTMKVEENTLTRDMVHCTCPKMSHYDKEWSWGELFWRQLKIE